ncbi:DUF4142 domain-containing protein [Methylobacterium oryzihabitans]|uniref:DUF4142 domain-containing protein n=1 Tax=Methylobacterium oryzihabitans TaxID=2499852 RepID=A0A3S2XGJ0_9HYPH|nr:DUF4142 domain-containing protein [Methylobacterium oryzihabitans]RVU14208.1 DUF4142 domain-containing protein [Methylobacterium oryzihabitans]
MTLKSRLAQASLVVAVSAAPLASAFAQGAPLPVLIPAGPGAATIDTEAFRAEALRNDAYSIEASRMALERSRNPKVRAHADQVIVNRQATTDALLPPGTSLTAGGTVVADGTRDGPFGSPLGLIALPFQITGAVVGGVVGGVTGTNPVNPIVDARPGEPGKRVALDPSRQKRLADLNATSGRRFDRTYTGLQAASDAESVRLYQAYARNGDSARGRTFAAQAAPMLQDEFDRAADLHGRLSEDDDAAF